MNHNKNFKKPSKTIVQKQRSITYWGMAIETVFFSFQIVYMEVKYKQTSNQTNTLGASVKQIRINTSR